MNTLIASIALSAFSTCQERYENLSWYCGLDLQYCWEDPEECTDRYIECLVGTANWLCENGCPEFCVN